MAEVLSATVPGVDSTASRAANLAERAEDLALAETLRRRR